MTQQLIVAFTLCLVCLIHNKRWSEVQLGTWSRWSTRYKGLFIWGVVAPLMSVVQNCTLLGQAWASPTLIMTTAPVRWIIVCTLYLCTVAIYDCIIYSAFVAPWFLRLYTNKYFVYSSILTCSHAWLTTAFNQQRQLDLLIVFREDYQQRQVGMNAQTYGINRFSPMR